MSKKNNKLYTDGYVYSTDPGFNLGTGEPAKETPPPAQQDLRIRYETKHRGGKPVTVVDAFIGTTNDLEELGRKLKSYCGTGGSAKDGIILVQGDQREKVRAYLSKAGYKYKG
jgi:translation initiation factor 1